MGLVKKSTLCGVGCGTGCSSFMVVFSFLYATLCLVYTLITRLYLQAYYTSAHIAALSVVLALFVFSHHCLYKSLRWSLSLTEWGFYLIHTILNVLYFILCLALAIAYSTVMGKGIEGTINFDYMTCTILAWVAAILMLYLLILTAAMTTKDRESYQLSQSGFTISSDPIIAYESADGINMQPMTQTIQQRNLKDSRKGGCCTLQCVVAVFHWFFYLLFHLIFVFFVSFSIYHAAGIVNDIIRFRLDQNMHVVHVANHRPLALYMECFGNGSDTIVYENGLGTSLWISKPFVPTILSEKYQVCVYDRRGYGWSDSVESDYADTYIQDPQRAKTNVDFLRALAEKLNISRPFYYAGHSYGGHHLIYMAMKYPEYIKGLIFLDSSEFGLDLGDVQRIMQVVANFKATGLLRLVFDYQLYDIYSAFSSVINLRDLPKYYLNQMLATSKSGMFFETYVRERKQIRTTERQDELNRDLSGRNFSMPCLVIWAGSPGSFPEEKFLAFNRTTDLHIVPGASHTELTMSYKYANTTANYIHDFISRYTV